jgi:hypothetical protein
MPDPRTYRDNLRDDRDGPGPGPGSELPEPTLTIRITSPSDGAVLNEPQNGQPITVTGTVLARRVGVEDVWVQVGNARFKATFPSGSGTSTWSSTVRVSAPGQTTLEAYVSGDALGDPITDNHSVTVHISDTVLPTLNIREPANGQVIPVAESGSNVLLRAEASDHLGIRSVTWEIDGKSGAATRDAATASDWTATVSIPAQSLGNRTITVRAVDLAGNEKSQSVAIVAKDTTPPTFRIDQPAPDQPFVSGSSGVTISVVGSAWDLQSGMVGGKAAVEWSLNGRTPFTKAKTNNNWEQWKADVPITDYGSHVIHLRFTDRDGNSVTHLHNVRVISSYRPKDVDERLAPRAYLEDVLRFARDHVTVPGEGPLSSDRLTAVFHQPFGTLGQLLSDIGNQPVNQLRVPIEVMRKHLSQRPGLLAAHWTFEADSILSNSSISDASGNNNTASAVSGMVLEDGVRGCKALSFDGATRFAQVNHCPTLAIGKDNADFSVAFSLYMRKARLMPGERSCTRAKPIKSVRSRSGYTLGATTCTCGSAPQPILTRE